MTSTIDVSLAPRKLGVGKTVINSVFVCAIVVLGTRFGGVFAVPPSNVAPIWLINAVLCAFLMIADRQQWPLFVGAGFLGYVIGELWIGFGPALSLLYALTNAAECVSIAYFTTRLMRPITLL